MSGNFCGVFSENQIFINHFQNENENCNGATLCKKQDDQWVTVIEKGNLEIEDKIVKGDGLNVQLVCEKRPAGTIYAPVMTSHENSDDPYEIVWRSGVPCDEHIGLVVEFLL